MRETFADGSWIETDEHTGNRTVYGSQAHKEYFKRLLAEQLEARQAFEQWERFQAVKGDYDLVTVHDPENCDFPPINQVTL